MSRASNPFVPRVAVARWNCLMGFKVQVAKRGRVIGSGTIDAVSPNSDYVWLAGHGVDSRRLIHRAEGYELLVDEHQAKVLNGFAQTVSSSVAGAEELRSTRLRFVGPRSR